MEDKKEMRREVEERKGRADEPSLRKYPKTIAHQQADGEIRRIKCDHRNHIQENLLTTEPGDFRNVYS